MRILIFPLLCLATPAFADTFTLRSAPQSVVVYPAGAKVTRVLTVNLPAGTHDIILPDLPYAVEELPPQIAITNATLEQFSIRGDALPPLVDPDDQAVLQAREVVKTKQAALDSHLDQEAEIRLQSDAAEAQLQFLKNMSQNEGLLTDVRALAEITGIVGEQTRQARAEILKAEKSIRALSEARKDLETELKDAKEALAAVLTADDDRVQAVLSVSTDVATPSEITVTYFAQAIWAPQYEFSLTQTELAQVSLKRGAIISQYSGEDWTDVTLELSTIALGEDIAPSRPYPKRLRISDPVPPKAANADAQTYEEPMMEAPVVVEESRSLNADLDFDGPGVSYIFPKPVSVANGVDALTLAMDVLTFDAETFAQASPMRDDTAYLMARFTNTSAEPIFKTYHDSWFYVDGNVIGLGDTPEIPAGAESQLPFGPIEELRLDRTNLGKNEGDSGIISRSNTQDDKVEIHIENLGDKPWNVELLDRVPYSEQEDLVITYSATPKPDVVDVDHKKGILQWNFDIAPKSEKTILLNHNILWPDGKILQ